MRLSLRWFFPLLFLLVPLFSYADIDRVALQAQLDELTKEIQQNQQKLSGLQQQRSSLERDLAILDSKIAQAQLEIKRRNLTIKQLKTGIAQKQAGIETLDKQVAKGQQSIERMLRITRQIDDVSFAEVALSGTFSDVFRELDNFATLQKALDESFKEMAAQRTGLSQRKAAQQSQQTEEQELLQIQVLQQNSLKDLEKQKKDLIAATKGQEATYQQVIASKQQTAAQIRAALFNLRDSSSVDFGSMYGYAKEAAAVTGVRAAFILGVLSEESDMGKNVGSCTYQGAMHPTRDVPVFLQLMAQLGLDPSSKKVSCAPSYGYGGAMGPAQFIPSTWQLYQARIAKATNQNPPNPWDPRTATFANAIYMADLGADQKTATAERTAALKYFAGSRWSNPAYAFYGNDVMCLAGKMQQNIDILEGKPVSGGMFSC